MAATTSHTYGPSCLLQADSNVFTRRASKVFIDAPPIKAQYFYCSSLPIDDPLSPIPPPPGGSAKATRVPPQPFSLHDNRDLEEAWLSLHKPVQSNDSREISSKSLYPQNPPSSELTPNNDERTKTLQEGCEEENDTQDGLRGLEASAHGTSINGASLFAGSLPGSGQYENQPDTKDFALLNETRQLTTNQPQQTSSSLTGNAEIMVYNDLNNAPLSATVPVKSKEIRTDEVRSNLQRKRSMSPFGRKERTRRDSEQVMAPDRKEQTASYRRLSRTSQKGHYASELGSSPLDRNTSGTPFLRVPSRIKRTKSRTAFSPDSQTGTSPANANDADVHEDDEVAVQSPTRPLFQRFSSSHPRETTQQSHDTEAKQAQVKVVVGVSRLHTVEMPSLKVSDIFPSVWLLYTLLTLLLDGANILGPCSRYILRRSWNLVLQRDNVACRIRTS